ASTVFDLEALTDLADKKEDAARAAYLHALELKSDDIEALGGIARLDVKKGRPQEATARLEAAVAKAPDNVDLLILSARAHASARDLAGTETLLLRAIEADPSNLQAYGLLGQVYAQQKRIDEATDRFREVLRRNPKAVS